MDRKIRIPSKLQLEYSILYLFIGRIAELARCCSIYVHLPPDLQMRRLLHVGLFSCTTTVQVVRNCVNVASTTQLSVAVCRVRPASRANITTLSTVSLRLLWPPYGIGQATVFCPVVSSFFYLSFRYLFSSPNLNRRRLDVYHTSSHGVAVSQNLRH